MYKQRSLKSARTTQLYAISGLVAGLLFLANINLQEVIRWDRFQHSFVSMLLFFIFLFVFEGQKNRWVLAFLMALFIGLGKEWIDHQAQGFDIVANVFGLSLATLFAFVSRPLFRI